ncbi:MAG: hypothetical protein ABIP79_15200 [Chitinophagaceae bacterium]
MKKYITGLSLFLLFVTAIALTSFQQDDRNKNQKKNNQDKKEKNSQGKKEKVSTNKEADDMMEQNNKKDKNNNSSHIENENEKGKGYYKKINSKDYDYNWTIENFKDRNKNKNNEKVLICHKFNSNDESQVTIRVSSNAIKAHMNHGDIMGECPPYNKKGYSNNYLQNRTDYYNTIEVGRDQMYYSQSILDYALERLIGTRQQIVVMQNNNMPVAEIERKQETIVVLERNVSLLETLINTAANILVDKFQ